MHPKSPAETGVRGCDVSDPSCEVADVNVKIDARRHAADLQKLVEALCAENEALRRDLLAFQYMRISSPLTKVVHWQGNCQENDGWRWWELWCPVCKRPVDVAMQKEKGGGGGVVAGTGSEYETSGVSGCGLLACNTLATDRGEDISEMPYSLGQACFCRMRNNMIVKALDGPDWSDVPCMYEVVWPQDRAGEIVELLSFGNKSPLQQLGGRHGEGFDIIAPAFQTDSIYGPLHMKGRHAYAASLWGADFGFCLGALVLGAALRRSGTKKDLVLLHTEDVPHSSRAILSLVWKLRLVEFIDADEGLFASKGGRFDGVFTKLHVLSLVDYDKVLMLDLDLAILECPDELFDLPAPAAMGRSLCGGPHGSKIYSRNFFLGGDTDSDDHYPWTQAGGINAGVMLLAPDLELHARAIHEVTVKYHPERIPGAGPEQDYLSRLFAPWWTHISVKWNFQLHRIFHTVDASVEYLNSGQVLEEDWTPERLTTATEDVRIVHFSGELKFWHRDPLSTESDPSFVDRLINNCSPWSGNLWLDMVDGETSCPYEGEAKEVGFKGVGFARDLTCRAVRQWRQDLECLPSTFPDLVSVDEIVRRLKEPSWPEGTPFKLGARVEVWWGKTHQWYPATVVGAYEDYHRLCVSFSEPGSWGVGARGIAYSYLREDRAYKKNQHRLNSRSRRVSLTS